MDGRSRLGTWLPSVCGFALLPRSCVVAFMRACHRGWDRNLSGVQGFAHVHLALSAPRFLHFFPFFPSMSFAASMAILLPFSSMLVVDVGPWGFCRIGICVSGFLACCLWLLLRVGTPSIEGTRVPTLSAVACGTFAVVHIVVWVSRFVVLEGGTAFGPAAPAIRPSLLFALRKPLWLLCARCCGCARLCFLFFASVSLGVADVNPLASIRCGRSLWGMLSCAYCFCGKLLHSGRKCTIFLFLFLAHIFGCSFLRGGYPSIALCVPPATFGVVDGA